MPAKPVMFNADVRAKKLKGSPKVVRIERQETAGPTEGARFLQEITEYRPDGREVERSIYRPDGTLSYRFFYEYSDEGDLSKITTVDGSGKTVQSRLLRSLEMGDEEEITLDSNGSELQRMITKRDRSGRVIESAVLDASGAMSVRLILHNDERGLLRDGELTLGDQVAVRVEVKHEIPDRTIVTCYAPDGSMLMRIETPEDEFNGELGQVLFADGSSNQLTKIEKIDARDDVGNWIQKTIVQGSTDQPIQVAMKVTRTITYY